MNSSAGLELEVIRVYQKYKLRVFSVTDIEINIGVNVSVHTHMCLLLTHKHVFPSCVH